MATTTRQLSAMAAVAQIQVILTNVISDRIRLWTHCLSKKI